MGATLPPIRDTLLELLGEMTPGTSLGRELLRDLGPRTPRAPLFEEGMPGLAMLERELLRVHRYELCRLLQLAAAECLWADVRAPWLLSPCVDRRRRHRRLDHEAFCRSIRASEEAQSGLSSTDHELDEFRPVTSLLRRCFTPSGAGWPGAIELFTAAIRLDPQRASRIGLGLALGLGGRLVEAETCLRDAIEGYPTVAEHALALQNLGAVLRWAGRLPESLVVCRQAASIAHDRPQLLVNWLDRGVLTDSSSDVVEAARALDALVAEEHFCIEHNAGALFARHRAEGLPAGHQPVDEARHLGDQVGPASRRVLFALHGLLREGEAPVAEGAEVGGPPAGPVSGPPR